MKLRPFIEVIDRLIYSGLSLDESVNLLARFLAEHKMYVQEGEKLKN